MKQLPHVCIVIRKSRIFATRPGATVYLRIGINELGEAFANQRKAREKAVFYGKTLAIPVIDQAGCQIWPRANKRASRVERTS